MKFKRDQITGAVLVIIGAVIGILVSRFETPLTAAYPGPKLLPLIGVIGLVVCGIGIFVNGCKQQNPDKVFLTKEGYIKVFVTFAALWVYIFLMRFFGFLLVTPFVLFGITTYFAAASKLPGKLSTRIIFSIVVTAVFYLMYVVLFDMPLPEGELFDLGLLIFG